MDGLIEDEGIDHVQMASTLTFQQQSKLKQEFSATFSKVPSNTDLITHHIETDINPPIKSSPFLLNGLMKEIVDSEIQQMLKCKQIKESHFGYL